MLVPDPSRPLARVLTALAVGMLLMASGCGHPANRAECDELFAKNAELELRAQRVSDPQLIADRTAAARAVEGEAFAGRCLGKRITNRALQCVRRAANAEQLDRCL